MSPAEFKYARMVTGMGVVEFGEALGYKGTSNTIGRLVRRIENGERPIPKWAAERAVALAVERLVEQPKRRALP